MTDTTPAILHAPCTLECCNGTMKNTACGARGPITQPGETTNCPECARLGRGPANHAPTDTTYRLEDFRNLIASARATSASGISITLNQAQQLLAEADVSVVEHLCQHALHQHNDCALARDLRILLNQALELAMAYHDERDHAQTQLDAIAALEVHGREFIDAAQLYAILGKPIPEPTDHAANIHAHNPYRT